MMLNDQDLGNAISNVIIYQTRDVHVHVRPKIFIDIQKPKKPQNLI